MRKHLKMIFSGGVASASRSPAVAMPYGAFGGEWCAGIGEYRYHPEPAEQSHRNCYLAKRGRAIVDTIMLRTIRVLWWNAKPVHRDLCRSPSVMADITTYYDTSIGGNNTYMYRVAAFDGDGFSAYSNTANCLHCGDDPAPSVRRPAVVVVVAAGVARRMSRPALPKRLLRLRASRIP